MGGHGARSEAPWGGLSRRMDWLRTHRPVHNVAWQTTRAQPALAIARRNIMTTRRRTLIAALAAASLGMAACGGDEDNSCLLYTSDAADE